MPELSGIGILAVLVAGVLSFVSPCVLPLVPGYVSYIAGGSSAVEHYGALRNKSLREVALSIFFVFGFSTVFMAFGASATAFGQLMLSYRYELNILGGIIVIVFGLFMIGLTLISAMQRDLWLHFHIGGGQPASAYTLGLAFGFGWTPCIGPILGTVLTATAATATVSEGVTLLAIYSLGLGVPFILAAIFTRRLSQFVQSVKGVGQRLQQGAGVIMVAVGVAMITGDLSALSYWLLDAFPALSKIG